MSDNPSRILFGQLFEANREKVYRFAFKLTDDRQRAEEVTQQCFIKLWENIHKVHKDQDVFPLLFVFVKHIVIDETRKLYRERKSLSQLSSNQVSSDRGDEDTLMRKEFTEQVHKLIEQMPEQRRNIYLLSRDKGKSHKEIADQLSLSPTTVRNHLNLALQYIRREMMAHYDM
ncbi:RNA polymerase sigma-70 factor [Chitinophaga pinensis]|jgi:RNA polymerase sigma-70 factor (ECF subfamily)|uniref:RNA polymerase, sigma-24 subunit, ECF subfamily n=1 Tax=Chitinophaga pinensis (strain ATCC 43595 / DSM 2588 / LMG 13176 / NBRC 15968 / NCIMB 11800 / UQM 2034) TaxID=485918 RepID=A0A979G1V1_CHIPD|nr:RNA polymerase sigma-70 factor [Chitinophaga pinensis]ACU59216.1 RNA polymerase, sigma-24 subunit, ECF subfamily [Chitinophaga pinensis DSM 2588]